MDSIRLANEFPSDALLLSVGAKSPVSSTDRAGRATPFPRRPGPAQKLERGQIRGAPAEERPWRHLEYHLDNLQRPQMEGPQPKLKSIHNNPSHQKKPTMMKNPLNILTAALILLNAGTVQSHAADWKPAQAPFMTRWAKEVSPTNALPEYPRPQMVRKEWMNLNGLWDIKLGDGTEAKILVPYPIESALSGVMKQCLGLQKLCRPQDLDLRIRKIARQDLGTERPARPLRGHLHAVDRCGVRGQRLGDL
ncbi:MAG: hypothetical protein RL630_697 [Verrucomicrobiota bacterium]